jgi:hypothetical protein
MASNLKETAVKTVNVEVNRLQEKLKENLETHKKEFEEAISGYREKRLELCRALRDTTQVAVEKDTTFTREAVVEAFHKYNRLERPQDHSNSYEQAIALMEWETKDVIELSINDFECYVGNNWQWQVSFKNAHKNYSSPMRS